MVLKQFVIAVSFESRSYIIGGELTYSREAWFSKYVHWTLVCGMQGVMSDTGKQ